MAKLKLISVFIVSHSVGAAHLMQSIVESDIELKVIGFALTNETALQSIIKLNPDIVLVDIGNSVDVTLMIMEKHPSRIVILAKYPGEDRTTAAHKSLEYGAIAVIVPPTKIIETIKKVAEEKVPNRINPSRDFQNSLERKNLANRSSFLQLDKISFPIKAIAIGASLGGPPALATILSTLPENFPIPIFIVQHISEGGAQNFSSWLNAISFLKVKVASHGERAKEGYVYIAPENEQMEIEIGNVINLTKCQENQYACPSIACLLKSMALVHRSHAIGMILTGMGNDGAKELLMMKQKGAFTIAQKEEECLMFDMPRAAIELGAVNAILSLKEINELLLAVMDKKESNQNGNKKA